MIFNFEKYITIVRDIEELERLGFKVSIKDGKVCIDKSDREVDVRLLNSYIGLVDRKDYYDDDTIITALIYKGEMR